MPETDNAVTASYWNDWDEKRNASRFRWEEWSAHPLVRRIVHENVFGPGNANLIAFLKNTYPHFANRRALSLCAGDGSFEKRLVENGVFGRITGMDLSENRVRIANANSPDPAVLDFLVGDVNDGLFGEAQYDVVLAKAALHHVENLENLFDGITRCLRPNGCLVTIDFFGASRFQWGEMQLELANRYLVECIPPELRRLDDGSVKTRVARPTIAEMIATDPSEAVRSAELMGFIEDRFPDRVVRDIGGSLLHLILTPDILENFDDNDPGHASIIETLYRRERQHIENGDLQADFKFIVAG